MELGEGRKKRGGGWAGNKREGGGEKKGTLERETSGARKRKMQR